MVPANSVSVDPITKLPLVCDTMYHTPTGAFTDAVKPIMRDVDVTRVSVTVKVVSAVQVALPSVEARPANASQAAWRFFSLASPDSTKVVAVFAPVLRVNGCGIDK